MDRVAEERLTGVESRLDIGYGYKLVGRCLPGRLVEFRIDQHLLAFTSHRLATTGISSCT